MTVNIVRAALRHIDSGLVYSVPKPGRHHDVIKMMNERGISATPGYEQGFITSRGDYVSREDAARIATRARQILPAPGGGRREVVKLFSEDIW